MVIEDRRKVASRAGSRVKLSKGLYTAVFLAIMVFSFITFNTYIEIQDAYADKEYRIQTIKNTQWEYTKAILLENYDKAKLKAEIMRILILADIRQEYGNDVERLKHDLDNPASHLPLYQIIDRNIRGIFLNKNSDSNDPFVFTKDGIIGDLSLDCSPANADGATFRTWEQEYAQTANPALAKAAVNAMLIRAPVKLFWEFLKSDDPNHRMLVYMSFNALESVFKDEGLEGLKAYEFISYVALYDEHDLVGRPLKTPLGTQNPNSKIIYIAQGFNLIDAINNNSPGGDPLNKESRIKSVIEQTNYAIRNEILSCISMIIVVITGLAGVFIAHGIK